MPCTASLPLALYASAPVLTLLAWPQANGRRLDVLRSIHNKMNAALLSRVLDQVRHCIVDLICLHVQASQFVLYKSALLRAMDASRHIMKAEVRMICSATCHIAMCRTHLSHRKSHSPAPAQYAEAHSPVALPALHSRRQR